MEMTKVEDIIKYLTAMRKTYQADSETLSVAIDTMRKYQMIKQLVNQAEYARENSYTGEAEWILTDSVYQKIREILEDGKIV